MAVFVEVLLPV